MPKLSQIIAGTSTITVDEGKPSEFHVTYKTGFYTTETEQLIGRLDQEGAPLQEASEILAKSIVGWDVTDDDGNPIVPTKELFADVLGLVFVATVLKAIIADAFPNPTTSNS